MYSIGIKYSWGEEEPIKLTATDKKEAWSAMKEIALKELVEVCENDSEVFNGLMFNFEKGMIVIHYSFDNTYCYYSLKEEESKVNENQNEGVSDDL